MNNRGGIHDILEHSGISGRQTITLHSADAFFSSSDYIQIRQPVYLSHTAGRYAAKRFRKAQCPIIERLTNSLMMNGRNSGKKLMAMRIVSHAFDIVRSFNPTFNPRFRPAANIDFSCFSDPHHDRPEPHPGCRRRHCQLRPP